jgi:hypothetical protein
MGKAMKKDEEFKQEAKKMIDGILPLLRGEKEYTTLCRSYKRRES